MVVELVKLFEEMDQMQGNAGCGVGKVYIKGDGDCVRIFRLDAVPH